MPRCRKAKIFTEIFKNLLLRNRKVGVKVKLGIHAKEISPYINCVFCFGRIRTLVAMATYIFHRLIMGKVETDNIFCLNENIWKIFLQKCF